MLIFTRRKKENDWTNCHRSKVAFAPFAKCVEIGLFSSRQKLKPFERFYDNWHTSSLDNIKKQSSSHLNRSRIIGLSPNFSGKKFEIDAQMNVRTKRTTKIFRVKICALRFLRLTIYCFNVRLTYVKSPIACPILWQCLLRCYLQRRI